MHWIKFMLECFITLQNLNMTLVVKQYIIEHVLQLQSQQYFVTVLSVLSSIQALFDRVVNFTKGQCVLLLYAQSITFREWGWGYCLSFLITFFTTQFISLWNMDVSIERYASLSSNDHWYDCCCTCTWVLNLRWLGNLAQLRCTLRLFDKIRSLSLATPPLLKSKEILHKLFNAMLLRSLCWNNCTVNWGWTNKRLSQGHKVETFCWPCTGHWAAMITYLRNIQLFGQGLVLYIFISLPRSLNPGHWLLILLYT